MGKAEEAIKALPPVSVPAPVDPTAPETEAAASDTWEKASERKKLQDVLAWLLLNSMRSEHLQHMQQLVHIYLLLYVIG